MSIDETVKNSTLQAFDKEYKLNEEVEKLFLYGATLECDTKVVGYDEFGNEIYDVKWYIEYGDIRVYDEVAVNLFITKTIQGEKTRK